MEIGFELRDEHVENIYVTCIIRGSVASNVVRGRIEKTKTISVAGDDQITEWH